MSEMPRQFRNLLNKTLGLTFTEGELGEIVKKVDSGAGRSLAKLKRDAGSDMIEKVRSLVKSLITTKNLAALMYAAALSSQFGQGDLLTEIENAITEYHSQINNSALMDKQEFISWFNIDHLIRELESAEPEFEKALEEYKKKITLLYEMAANNATGASDLLREMENDPRIKRFSKLTAQLEREMKQLENLMAKTKEDPSSKDRDIGARGKIKELDVRMDKLVSFQNKSQEIAELVKGLQEYAQLQGAAKQHTVAPEQIIRPIAQSNSPKASENTLVFTKQNVSAKETVAKENRIMGVIAEKNKADLMTSSPSEVSQTSIPIDAEASRGNNGNIRPNTSANVKIDTEPTIAEFAAARKQKNASKSEEGFASKVKRGDNPEPKPPSRGR